MLERYCLAIQYLLFWSAHHTVVLDEMPTANTNDTHNVQTELSADIDSEYYFLFVFIEEKNQKVKQKRILYSMSIMKCLSFEHLSAVNGFFFRRFRNTQQNTLNQRLF